MEALLGALYGRVEKNYRFSLGVRPEDYRSHRYFSALANILNALEANRGFTNFVRAPSLPNVDFFVPDPGFILEFDESQHFSLARKIAIENYPADLTVGFSLNRWISLCVEIAARDEEPPFRDEQRAWYDTLRDFVPAFEHLRPTVRLYAGAMRWCEFDPENPEDLSRFREFVERKGNVR